MVALHRINPATHLAQISEANILNVAKHLSENIGYRTVGTREHAVADEWMSTTLEQLGKECRADGLGHCDVWRQVGSGSHRYMLHSI